MATWKYEISVSGTKILPKGGTCSAVIRRIEPASVSNIGLYQVASSQATWSSNATISTWTSAGISLTFGQYGWVPLSYNENTHSESGTLYDLDNSILDVGTGGQTITIYEDDSGGNGSNHVTLKSTVFTINVSVSAKYNYSNFSCTSPVNFGESSSVSITNSMLASLNHKVTWRIDNAYTHTISTGSGANSAVFNIPTSWMAACSTSSSTSCTVTVETFYGTDSIGSTSKVIQIVVPGNVVPTIESLTAAIYNDKSSGGIATSKGIFIQNLTGITLTANNVSAGTGASISSYSFSSSVEDDGIMSGNTYTISTLGYNGNITYSVTVKDSRGRTASAQCIIKSIAYNLPVITAYDAYRCTQNGTGSENGTYASIRCAANVSPVTVNGTALNTMTIKSYYYISTTGEPQLTQALGDMTSGVVYVIGGALSNSYKYYVRFVVSDFMGGTAQTDVIISSAAYAIHVKNGGTGVAFGKTSEISNSVEINTGWNLYYKGFQMPPIVYSATDAPANPVTGLIWLKKK